MIVFLFHKEAIVYLGVDKEENSSDKEEDPG